MQYFRPLALFLIMVLGWGNVAYAQTLDDFAQAFAGQWLTFSLPKINGNPCTISFDGTSKNGSFGASTSNCIAPLDQVATWTVQSGQLVLLNAAGGALVSLGGNQFRLTGQFTSGRTLIVERMKQANANQQLRLSIKCAYVGYSSDCAKPKEFLAPNTQDNATALVQVLVDLNSRREPRLDAEVIKTLPKNSCVAVSECVLASDGNWCKAQIDQQSAWFKKQAVRDGKWPIITFVNGCTTQ